MSISATCVLKSKMMLASHTTYKRCMAWATALSRRVYEVGKHKIRQNAVVHLSKSLVHKLTQLKSKMILSYLFVGILGSMLVAIIISQRAEATFGQFVNRRDHREIADVLSVYFSQNNGWFGVDQFIHTSSYLDLHSSRLQILGENERIFIQLMLPQLLLAQIGNVGK